MVDVLVIGAGLIGSAAARHLAESGLSVQLLGARQGNTWGIHASHYDEARITRLVGPDLVWADLAQSAIERYSDLESRSGVRFHTPCGHVRIDHPLGHPSSRLKDVRAVAASRLSLSAGSSIRELSAVDAMQEHPFLNLALDAVAHMDPAPSGIIHPRRLIDAQHVLIRKAGGEVRAVVIEEVVRHSAGFSARSSDGTDFQGRKVLVATGSYVNHFPLTPERLAVDVRPETVLLVETNESLRAELDRMPGMLWDFEPTDGQGPQGIDSVYILPPVLYPDGRWYLKIGADHDEDVDVSSIASMHRYMKGKGSQQTAHELSSIVDWLIPVLKGAPRTTKPCLLSYSPHGRPMIDEVADGWYVAVAGCGKSAKSSDESGRLASELVQGNPWSGYSRETFRAVAAS